MSSADQRIPASGIYALVRFDGGPVDDRHAAELGLETKEPAVCRARGLDVRAPDAVQEERDRDRLTILVGHIEAIEEIRQRLGLPRRTPPVMLARAALTRFGSDMPSEVIGEWSLLDWQPGQVTLMGGAGRRDRLFYAMCGKRLAVAPDPFALSRLSWVGTEIDETGFILALGRGKIREQIGDRTMLARVRQLEPGSSITVSARGIRTAKAEILTSQPRWQGSFDDAMDQAEQLIRTILRERLMRTRTGAIMLSGGLDSSTLACFAALERQASQPLLVFTSVAPPGSGLPDEAGFARSVAHSLELESHHVYPPEDANLFRPPDAVLAGAGGPPLPTRHCLTETFQAAARTHGATMLLDGTWGELTLTAYSMRPGLRQRLRELRGILGSRIVRRSRMAEAFHVRLSQDRVAQLPEMVTRALRSTELQPVDSGPKGLWGYHLGASKALRHANEFYGGAVRVEFPYRDLRLLRLFASFPTEFADWGGTERAPARHVTAGLLPDSIRLRTSGRPASPDHLRRMHRQAPKARSRIGAFRRAHVDEWLDLDWLDAALARISSVGAHNYQEANEVQLTAIAAEFLTWWRARS